MVNGLHDRLGASLRRAPYVWLVASVLSLFFMTSPLRVVAKKPADASTPWTVAGVLLIVYCVVVYLVLASPRMQAAVAQKRSANQLALTRWMLAFAPFLLAFVTVVCGGQPWVWAVGFITSTVLFVRSARALAKSALVA